MNPPREVVIVGGGMAGMRLAEEITDRDPDGSRCRVTVVSEETGPAYNRVLLSGLLAGTLSAESLMLYPPGWAESRGVRLHEGVVVTSIDTRGRAVHTSRLRVPYDVLVLATGAEPRLPPVEGLTGEDGVPADGVVPFRTLGDCRRIAHEATRRGARVAILGGGLLGLEAACALAGRGCAVTVVHPSAHLMERHLDHESGTLLVRRLEAHGIGFRLGRYASRYLPDDGLKLDDGGHVEATLVVVAAGVRPRTELAVAAGLAVEAGIVVDDLLRTSAPAVHAIGDVAQHPGAVSGLVQSAWEQAEALAELLTGGDARYVGTPTVTRLKARDIELAVVGASTATGAEELRFSDSARGRYAKLLVDGDRVRGAIMLGFPDAAASVAYHHVQSVPVPDDRLALLLGRALPADAPASGPAVMAATATVCRCNHITKADLVDAWHAGADDADALIERTRAGTGCGSCRPVVRSFADWLSDETLE
ncbi:FAD-dependent oxidoreductase [Spongiactinospora sp. TRM90649]|uniref:FAD-dependent oxidoreductase n=1 Tax=Spongiactinospora sp. TRM90649 TaxID=3031114 RepID=UPI0023F8AB12|nr:FAD-dependent oxidoreductase [Spongiactinospora sp. TRM90649]MDF5753547.1 FAD-dependent oxidoreductase [Spongiactinospora sp. TRM90649]